MANIEKSKKNLEKALNVRMRGGAKKVALKLIKYLKDERVNKDFIKDLKELGVEVKLTEKAKNQSE